jgi:small subunit ribosomal protein S7
MKLFGKYGTEDVEIKDLSLRTVVYFGSASVHTFGRHQKRQHGKFKINIVERLVNKLMRGGTGEKTSGKVIRTKGRLQGKKMQMINVVEHAFELIQKKANANPIQVLVKALENSAPREDVTRVSHGGVSYQIAVDVSATRRLDMALRNITLSALMRAFNKPTSLSESLADEIIYTANGDLQNSYSIKKRDELERMARSAK